MAIALVRLGTVATGASPQQPAFGQATGAGNLLVAWVVSSITSSDPTANQAWSKAIGIGGLVGGLNCLVFYKPNSAANETAPTFTHTTATLWACLAEFSGADTGSPLDQTGTLLSGVTSPQTLSAASADSASGELMVTTVGHLLSKAGTVTTTDTYNNGATASGNLNNDATSTNQHYRLAYGITTGNASADADTITNGSMNLSEIDGVIATFKVATTTVYQPRFGFTNFQDPGVL